jgi:hypothetical protein
MLANVHCLVVPIMFPTYAIGLDSFCSADKCLLADVLRDERLLSPTSIVLTVELQVHFHVIPKPNEQEGLGIGWPAQQTDMDGLKKLHEALKAKM